MEDIIYSREKKRIINIKKTNKCKEYSWDKCAKQTINVYRYKLNLHFIYFISFLPNHKF